MAHVMKMTRAAVGHLFKHYERAVDENGQYLQFGNQDIHPAQSYLNYNLAPKRESQGDFLKKRCSEVKCLNRKDVNVACSWIVTLPKDFKELNQGKNSRDFFEGTYQFLEKRYGKENIISAYVHMDETTPHLHFCFVPVIYDTKKKQYKVSAKEVINRYELQTFHEELRTYLIQSKGLYATILNEATIEGNKSIEELKRGTAIGELKNAHIEVQKVKEDIMLLEHDKNALEGKINDLQGEILSFHEVNQIKIKKPLLGNEKTVISLPYQDAINLQRTAQRIYEVDGKLKIIEQKTKELKKIQDNLAKEREEILKRPMKEQMERSKLIKENNVFRKQINAVNRIMEKRPDLMAQLQKEAVAIRISENNKGIIKGVGLEQ